MNPYIILVWIASLVLAAAGGWGARGDHEAGKQLKTVTETVERQAKAQDTVDQLGEKQAETNATQAVKDRIITREVTRYVQVTPPAARCALPGTWRVRHDAAATGQPTDTAGLAASAAEPVADAAALDTVSENYTACRQYIRQLDSWNDWWASVKDLCRSGAKP